VTSSRPPSPGLWTPRTDEEIDACVTAAWSTGHLSWLLREHQRAAYAHYRQWELQPPAKADGQFGRLYGLDVSKRWGKSSLRCVIRLEDCRRNPKHKYRYVTAFQDDISEIVDDVMRVLLDGGDHGEQYACPEHLRPKYFSRRGAQPAGMYFPDISAALVLAGLDMNPNALRGRASDGDDVSEAAFVRHLEYSLKNVLYHQYQGKPHARACIESSAPLEPDTKYDTVLLADCKKRGAVWSATIDDNTSLSDEEREEFIRAAGGRDHVDCKREYYNIRERDPERHIIPEFDMGRHVGTVEPPEWYDGYTAGDEGLRDKMALGAGYYHHELGKLVVKKCWAKSNASTAEVARVAKGFESELWGTWDKGEGGAWVPGKEPALRWEPTTRTWERQPFQRTIDAPARIIYDLAETHGIQFVFARKARHKEESTALTPSQAMVQALRTAFENDWILIDPDCAELIAHVLHGKWNAARTDWERTKEHGHYDLLAMLVYLWRLVMIHRNRLPIPPQPTPTVVGTSSEFTAPRKRHSDNHQALLRAMGAKR